MNNYVLLSSQVPVKKSKGNFDKNSSDNDSESDDDKLQIDERRVQSDKVFFISTYSHEPRIMYWPKNH